MEIFFIRDPLTREWKIVLSEPFCFNQIDCSHCKKGRQNQHVITIWKDGEIKPIPPNRELEAQNTPWDMRVVSFGCPFFRIETQKKSQGISGLYDKMRAPGAHECVEFPAQRTLMGSNGDEIYGLLRLYHHRLKELAKDETLGHPFIFHYDQVGSGQNLSHIIMAPFVVRHEQEELNQLHDRFKLKERCLICDILNDAKKEYKPRAAKVNVELERDGDFCLYLRPYTDFELWITPVDEYHWRTASEAKTKAMTSPATDFKEVPEEQLKQITNLLHYALNLFRERLTRKRMHTKAIGAKLALYTQPNINWGIKRGYWQSILDDFHWTIRVSPIFDPPLTPFGFFRDGTGNDVVFDIGYMKKILLE